MSKPNLFIGIFVAVLLATGIIGFSKVSHANAKLTEVIYNYTISKSWELPAELNEVSGIVWIDSHTLACIQDENGVIFMYDLEEKSIVDEIPFAGNGDYEAIALHENDIYVMQSDGVLYKVKNWKTIDKVVSSQQTGFKSSNNMESLTYSVKDNGLLTAPKDRDISDDYKNIYKISLSSQIADIDTPVYKIDMHSAALKSYKSKKVYKTFNPSEIAVHPKTNDIYVLEGKNPKLLILDSKGILKTVYKLDEINFPQPEGMTFSDEGDLYISNEAASGPATIHLIELKSVN